MSRPSVDKLFDLSGRVVLVTGAARGVGAGIVERFAEAGASVVVHYRSSGDDARALAERLDPAVALGADLTVPAEVEELFAETERSLGAVDVLVNNAGVYPLDPLLDAAPGRLAARRRPEPSHHPFVHTGSGALDGRARGGRLDREHRLDRGFASSARP